MVHSKVLKLALNDCSSYLGMEKGCFTVKDKDGNVERFPLFENEIGEIQIKSGNAISSGALTACGFWGNRLSLPNSERQTSGDAEKP